MLNIYCYCWFLEKKRQHCLAQAAVLPWTGAYTPDSFATQMVCSSSFSPLMMTGLVTALLLSSQLPVDVSYQDGEGGGAGIFTGGTEHAAPIVTLSLASCSISQSVGG